MVLVTGCTGLLLLLLLVFTASACQSSCFTYFGVRAISSIGSICSSIGYYLLFLLLLLLLLLLKLLDGGDCIIELLLLRLGGQREVGESLRVLALELLLEQKLDILLKLKLKEVIVLRLVNLHLICRCTLRRSGIRQLLHELLLVKLQVLEVGGGDLLLLGRRGLHLSITTSCSSATILPAIIRCLVLLQLHEQH